MTNNLVLPVDEELTLRQFSLEDAEVIFALIERNRTHLSQHGDTTSEKYNDIDSVLQSILKPHDPNRLRMGIWVNQTYTGTINLTSYENNSAEIGYYLGKEFEGHGYIGRSLQRLVRYAFEAAKLDMVFAKVHPANERSIHAITKAGFIEDSVQSTADECYYVQTATRFIKL